jgi:hypothetical protein
MKTKLLLIHNVVAPYRLPLFEEVAKKVNLTVSYIQKNDENRLWKQKDVTPNYQTIYLNSERKKIFGKNIFFLKSHDLNFNDYDLIILPDDQTYFLVVYQLLLKIKQCEKLPKIIFWTGNFSYYRPFNSKNINGIVVFLLSFIRKTYFYNYANFFWSYSNNTTRLLIERFEIPNKVISTGLQGYPEKQILFNHKDINYTKRYNSKSLVFIGYPSKRKNLEFVANTLKKYDNINFKIYCIGPIPTVKIENITYLGYFDKREKFEQLNNFSYAILPSKAEPWGWVVNECMAIGLPILVSEAVMAKEMITDEQLIFDLNENSLIKSLNYINELSLENYTKLSKESIANSKFHTLQKTTQSFDKILDNIQ